MMTLISWGRAGEQKTNWTKPRPTTSQLWALKTQVIRMRCVKWAQVLVRIRAILRWRVRPYGKIRPVLDDSAI
jgi:hypothetical protein